MIISMAIYREQSLRSIQFNKSNRLFKAYIHTIYIYHNVWPQTNQVLPQCLEVNHSIVHSIINLGWDCNGGQIPTSPPSSRGSYPSVVLLRVLTRLGGKEHLHWYYIFLDDT